MTARELEALRRRARVAARPAHRVRVIGGEGFGLGGWAQWLRWRSVAVRGEVHRWQAALPTVFGNGFVFTAALWVAVFSVSGAVLATLSIPLRIRYAVGLAALTYLYFHAAVARLRRPISGSLLIFTVADAAAVTSIYLLSAPYVEYAQLLLFFVVARMAARFRDVRVAPAAMVLAVPFLWPHRQGPAMFLVLEAFGVLVLMLGVQHMLGAASRARLEAGLQATLAAVASSLARATTQSQVVDHLSNLVPPLASGCAWAFWLRDPEGTDFRVERWYGLPDGEHPVRHFAPLLGSDPTEGTELTGPLPGTSFGEVTLVQPEPFGNQVLGLIMVAGKAAEWGGGRRELIRSVASEAGVALARIEAYGDQRRRSEAMEIANRLAGLIAGSVRDPASALNALRQELQAVVLCESVHIEWLIGDFLEFDTGPDDPVFPFIPARLPSHDTRAGEACTTNEPLTEPVTGRRPEDVLWAAAHIRYVAVIPFRGRERIGTLQVGRKEPRPFTAGEGLLLRLLAERLAIAFEAGQGAAPRADVSRPPVMTRSVTES